MDLFGFDTESELTAWVVENFQVRKNVEVKDTSNLNVTVEVVLFEDGCCEICWVRQVQLNAEYEGHFMTVGGEYDMEENGDIFFYTRD
jgi:hypothetical protein